MALNESTKLSLLFKKLLGREFSTFQKSYYEEIPGGRFNVHSSEVWADPIPTTPPGASTSVIKVYKDVGGDGALKLVEDVTVGSLQGWYAEDPPSTRLRQFVSPKYGLPYAALLHEDNGSGTAKGAAIPTSDPIDWFFDYETGYVSIQDSHSYTTPFWLEGYYYIGNSVGGDPIFDDTLSTGSIAGSAFWEYEIDVHQIQSGEVQFLQLEITSGTTVDTDVRLYDDDPSGAGVVIYQTTGLDLVSEIFKDPNMWWMELAVQGSIWARVYNNGGSASEYGLRLRIKGDVSTPFGE